MKSSNELEKINLEDSLEFDNHELVTFFYDNKAGLKGFVAIHTTKPGPAVGGTRLFNFFSEAEALEDALRLSRAMTYKCALAGVKYGGGKGVIICDPRKKNKKLLAAYAKKINTLNGNFFTGQDVGISEADVAEMLKYSKSFIGKPGIAGDPSPYAALSTFYSIQSAAKTIFGSDDLNNRTVAVKGAGNVGGSLIGLLAEAGAKIIAADICLEKIKNIKKNRSPISIVDSKEIHKQKADIYAPCALGMEITSDNLKEIKAKIICGAANNQLATSEMGDLLHKRGILYAPDYVVNAGGLINVVDELESGGYKPERVASRIKDIKITLAKIFEISDKKNLPTSRVADNLAQQIIKSW